MEKTKSRLNAKSVTNFLSNNAITLLILLMVIYRLMTAIYTPYVYAATNIQVDIGGYAFTATSNIALNPGYRIIDGILRAELRA